VKNFAIVLGAFLVGCASGGVHISDEKIQALKKGETRYTQVVEAWGPASAVVRPSDGSTVATWAFYQATARPETFIPLIGGLIGGADSKSSSVTLRFDTNGVLIDYTSVNASSGMGTGFAAGAPAPRTGQPKQ
jgi:hypothetical protein